MANQQKNTSAFKYGLLSYETENIGDEIQSIAARRFVPRIDYYINRDHINQSNIQPQHPVKVIMNGWYTHYPENWPPKVSWLDPLLIAIHVDQHANHKSIDAFVSSDSKAFLKKYGPIGARDIATLQLFQENKIDAYLSQCLTLTLLPEKTVKKQDYILAVDVPNTVIQEMKKNTSRPIIALDTYRMTDLSTAERFKISEFFLTVYQAAHAVVTMRLHTMLPCLALHTPVLALTSADRDPGRYSGLIDLVNNMTIEDYLASPSSYNLNNPPQNPDSYKTYAADLAERCHAFTGYDSKKSYLNEQTYAELMSDRNLISGLSKCISSSYSAITLLQKEQLLSSKNKEINELKGKIDQLDERIKELENMGIKMSSRQLRKATKAFIKKHFKN